MIQQFEDFSAGHVCGGADGSSMVSDPFAKHRGKGSVVTGRNGVSCDELARMGQERFDLRVNKSADVFDMIWLVGFKEKGTIGAVNLKTVVAEIVRITGSHDAVECEPSGIAMIGMESVSLPRIMSENDIGLNRTDPVGNLIANVKCRLEFAIDMTKHDDLASRAEPTGCFHLLRSAHFNEFVSALIGIPSSFGAVGKNEMVDDTSCSGPFGKSAAALKFGIVGMSNDDERALRSWKVA